MSERNERILTKDDSDLFQLIRRLTDERPPEHALDLESVIIGDRLVLSTRPDAMMPANIREIELNLPGVRVTINLEPTSA